MYLFLRVSNFRFYGCFGQFDPRLCIPESNFRPDRFLLGHVYLYSFQVCSPVFHLATYVSCGIVGSVPILGACLWTSALWCCKVAVQFSFSVCVKVFPHPLWIYQGIFLYVLDLSWNLSLCYRAVGLPSLYIVCQLMDMSNLCWSLVYGNLLVSCVLSICL